MNKILFILNYRAGTNLWHFINGKREVPFAASVKTKNIVGAENLINPEVTDDRARTPDWEGGEHSFFLATKEPQICPCENYFVRDINTVLATNPPFNHISWRIQHGDWWGAVPNHKAVPEPYEVDTPMRLGPEELAELGPGWRFIYFTRDGRNQIESLRNIPGGIEQEYHQANPTDYFQVLCKSYRNRAKIVSDNLKRFPNFKLVKFEDFVKNPVDTLADVYEFAGLTLDRNFAQRAYDLTIKSKAASRHSSFKSKKFQERWHAWNDWEKDTFEKIAGKQLRALGYE